MRRDLKGRAVPVLELLEFIISVLVLGAVIVDYGFVLDAKEEGWLELVYDISWWTFFVLFTARLAGSVRHLGRRRVALTVFMAAVLYLSALPRFFPQAAGTPWLSGIWAVLGSRYWQLFLLVTFAVMAVSRGIVNFINKNTNPALLLAASFAAIIFVGTILLLVPRSTLEHIRLPVVDALFVSTSAVCVTGLSTVELARTFTLEGQLVIMLLIQTGGLGVMTITSFFAMFFMGNTGVYNQFAVRDMINGTDRSGSLMSTLLHILGFTFVIELCGAALIWLNIRSTLGMPLEQELFFSVFHSVSAFCNAGFSTLEGNLGNPVVLYGGNGFYLVISLLVVLGGIGFPILVNFAGLVSFRLKSLGRRIFAKKAKRTKFVHLANVNTRIVLIVTLVLLAGGTALMAVLEWNGAFAGMSAGAKLTQSFFNAVAPRTAGFNSVDIAGFSRLTILVYIFLMWIGGGSQSTAGGIKVNVFAVAWANLAAVIRGRGRVVLLGREIPDESVRRASSVVFGSIFTIAVFFGVLAVLEPDIPLMDLMFETVSAFATVGSSLGVTPLLSDASKVVVTLLMFIGRVGLITLLTSFVRSKGDLRYRFPKDNIIIN